MIGVCKFLALLFASLAVLSLAHDAFRAFVTHNRFTLSEIGGLFQEYAPEEHDAMRAAIVEQTDVKTFNRYFATVLSLPTLLLTGGLATLFAGVMVFSIRRHNRHTMGPRYNHRPNIR